MADVRLSALGEMAAGLGRASDERQVLDLVSRSIAVLVPCAGAVAAFSARPADAGQLAEPADPGQPPPRPTVVSLLDGPDGPGCTDRPLVGLATRMAANRGSIAIRLDLPRGQSDGPARAASSPGASIDTTVDADNGADAEPGARPDADRVRWLLVAPLVARGDVIGALGLARGPDATPFTAHEVTLFADVAALVAAALERTRLAAEATEAASRARAEATVLTRVNEVARALAAAGGEDEIHAVLARSLPSLVPADLVAVVEIDDGAARLALWGPPDSTGTSEATPTATTTSLPAAGSWVDAMRRQPRLLRCADLAQAEIGIAPLLRERGLRSALAAPVLEAGRLVGCLAVASYRTAAYSADHELALTTAARLLGSTLERVRLQEQAASTLRDSEARLRQVIELVPHWIFAKDATGRYMLANSAMASAWGLTPEQVVGHTDDELVPDLELRAHFRRDDESVLRHGEHISLAEEALVLPGGEVIYLQGVKLPLAGTGDPGVLGVCVDVTERRRAQQALWESERRLQHLYDDHPAMLLTVGANSEIRSINRFGAAELGHQVEELLGRPVTDLHAPPDRAGLLARIDGLLYGEGSEELARWEARMVTRDGRQLWMRQTGRAVVGADGERQVLVVCEDVTEVHELSEQLRHQATHDALTGLINRYEFERRLARVIDTARRDGSTHVLCYLDLDHFKIVNDSCGHWAGDTLLRRIAATLGAGLEPRHTLARLGGDEFALLLEHTTVERALPLLERLRVAVEELRFGWGRQVFDVTVSIGVIDVGADTGHTADVVAAADSACYSAKDAGRNRVEARSVSDDDLARRRREMQWPGRTRAALDDGRFTLMAQPLVEIDRTGAGGDRVVGYELLVRMRELSGELVPPGAFLPAAERYNLATRVDRWVLHRACELLSGHPRAAAASQLWCINLSGQSLAHPSFFADALQTVAACGVPAGLLCFEVTESAAVSDLALAERHIAALRDLGCRFALDDFGSGFSSFGYLRQLNVDFLKIYGALVRTIADDPVSRAMVRSVHDVAAATGTRTIAEYVESPAVLEELRSIGVDLAQGFALGRPEPLADVLARAEAG